MARCFIKGISSIRKRAVHEVKGIFLVVFPFCGIGARIDGREAMMRHKKGFTLVEVLLVVVVIGVLAAIIIPKLVSVPEKAFVAEANTTLGAIMRAQRVNVDKGSGFLAVSDNVTPAPWQILGMIQPGSATASGNGAKFSYTCNSATQECIGYRLDQPNKWAKLSAGGTWTCGPEYTPMLNGGCRLL